jgi:hypothetical protein
MMYSKNLMEKVTMQRDEETTMKKEMDNGNGNDNSQSHSLLSEKQKVKVEDSKLSEAAGVEARTRVNNSEIIANHEKISDGDDNEDRKDLLIQKKKEPSPSKGTKETNATNDGNGQNKSSTKQEKDTITATTATTQESKMISQQL